MIYSPLNYALKLLEKRDYSIGGLKKKMSQRELTPEDIDKVIDFLKEKKFLDDERFAKNFIKNQLSIKPQGGYQLRNKLKLKFISEDIIDKTLVEHNTDEESFAQKAAEKWLKINSKKENKKERLFRHLIGRGFNYEIVREVTQRLLNC